MWETYNSGWYLFWAMLPVCLRILLVLDAVRPILSFWECDYFHPRRQSFPRHGSRVNSGRPGLGWSCPRLRPIRTWTSTKPVNPTTSLPPPHKLKFLENINKLWAKSVLVKSRQIWERHFFPGAHAHCGATATRNYSSIPTDLPFLAIGKKHGPTAQAIGKKQGPKAQAIGKKQGPTAQAIGKKHGPTAQAIGKKQGPTAQAIGKKQGPTAQAVGKKQVPVIQVVRRIPVQESPLSWGVFSLNRSIRQSLETNGIKKQVTPAMSLGTAMAYRPSLKPWDTLSKKREEKNIKNQTCAVPDIQSVKFMDMSAQMGEALAVPSQGISTQRPAAKSTGSKSSTGRRIGTGAPEGTCCKAEAPSSVSGRVILQARRFLKTSTNQHSLSSMGLINTPTPNKCCVASASANCKAQAADALVPSRVILQARRRLTPSTMARTPSTNQ